MTEIKFVTNEDKAFWYTLDGHLSIEQFELKVRDKMGYVIFEYGKPGGILRYNLFWDNTPFFTLLFIDWNAQKKGYLKNLMEHWESDMKSKGYGMVMVSTRVDESAQHFYRKLGYKECGGFTMEIPGYEQPMEMIMTKKIR